MHLKHQVTQGAEERDNKAQQILRETRQVVEQVSTEQLAGESISCSVQVTHLLICQQEKSCQMSR